MGRIRMKALQHFITITKHRHAVIRNCKKAGILWQGLFHDLSKYTPTEFFLGAKYYQGDKSPNVGERADKGYSEAWMHHKGRNKHHFEYWTDYQPAKREVGPIKMPIKYVKEMFCDRVAASQIYKGKDYTTAYPLEYFLGGKAKRMIDKETSDLLEEWLVMLKEQGEEKTFAHIRKVDRY